MIINKQAIEFINKQLNLPAQGNEQDWEVELADPNRLNEFISFYETNDLPDNIRYALMSLVIASYDAYLSSDKNEQSALWDKIQGLIKKDEDLFADLLKYWALPGENDPEHWFNITPYIRRLLP